MKQIFTVINTVLAMLLLLWVGNVNEANSVSADGGKLTYLPVAFSDYYSGILPPKFSIVSQKGPEGGTITVLAASPNQPGVIFAGSWGSGVYKSIDHGNSWSFANKGIEESYIYSMAVDPTNPKIIYAGTYLDGVYKTTNGGVTWSKTGPGLNVSATVYALAVNPKQPNIVLAGTRGDNPASNTGHCYGATQYWYGGVFRSADGGASWTNVDAGLSCGYVYGLAIDSTDPSQVYVATHEKGVLRSGDGGLTFYYQNSYLPDLATRSIIIDPTNHNRLFLGTWHGAAVIVGNISPNGINWNYANGGEDGISGFHVMKVLVDPSSTTGGCPLLYALTWEEGTGLARSLNCGTTWTRFGPGYDALFTYDLVIDPSDPAFLLLGLSRSGVFKSLDRGKTWSMSDTGLYNTNLSSLISDPTNPSTLYVGTTNGSGVFKSINGGDTYTLISSYLPLSDNLYPSVQSIIADPATPGALYVGTDGGGIFKSTNNGESWQDFNAGIAQSEDQANSVAQSSSLLPDSTPFDAPFLEESQSSIQLTPALSLQAWTIPVLLSDPLIAGTLFAGTWTGVYRLDAGASSWTAIGLASKPIFCLAVDPLNSGILYAGTSTGIYKTVNGGASWDPAGLPNDLIYALAIDKSYSGILYAGTAQRGIFKSYDSGATWYDDNLGLGDLHIFSLAVDQVHPEFQYAGTTSGLYRSTKGGALWELVKLNQRKIDVNSINLSQTASTTLSLGTHSGSVSIHFMNLAPVYMPIIRQAFSPPTP